MQLMLLLRCWTRPHKVPFMGHLEDSHCDGKEGAGLMISFAIAGNRELGETGKGEVVCEMTVIIPDTIILLSFSRCTLSQMASQYRELGSQFLIPNM